MSKFLFPAVAALTLSAPAAFASEHSFTRDGITYTYTIADKDGRQVIEGAANKGDKFRLTVRNGWVDGYVNQTRVSFRAPKAKAPAELAAR